MGLGGFHQVQYPLNLAKVLSICGRIGHLMDPL